MQDVEIVLLTKGMFALVDGEDFERVSKFNWHVNIDIYTVYALTHLPYMGKMRMHSLILNSNEEIDHINRCGLDNRKSNLRPATQQQNRANTRKNATYAGRPTSSIYKGVSWHTQLNKWHSKIVFNYRKYSLGVYDDEEDAARAYNKKAVEFFGEFASLNDVDPLFPQ